MRRRIQFRYREMFIILGVFLLIALVLFVERSGIRYEASAEAFSWLEEGQWMTAEEAAADLEETCLVLMNSEEVESVSAWEQFQQIFLDMKIGYHLTDVATQKIPALNDYQTVVVLMSVLSPLGEDVITLTDWVGEGGYAMFALTLQKETYLSLIEHKLGIISSSYEYAMVDSIYVDEDFMIGGGRSYMVEDGYESAWTVQLDSGARVYARTDDEKQTPLIWSVSYGDGLIVVDNFGLYTKAMRGFYAASYSLMQEACAWPVIDGSVFYLDDFPSPVPGGNGEYIERDYGVSIADFYSLVWWPDVLELGETYGIVYTGGIIETYEDDTDGNVSEQMDTGQFQYYGNMLLRRGGELCWHGYNHQPLVLSDERFETATGYSTWDSLEAMTEALTELKRFSEEMFPDAEMSVYIPPSNDLSEEGIALLAEEFPQIRSIASVYLASAGESTMFAYVQEFGVSEDGIVEQPRIVSSCNITDYMQLAAVSELNMHFVNSHFMHPDDVLDEGRGAELGWEDLKSKLASYMEWLFDAAPMIRSLTGSQMAQAIQRYAALTVSTDYGEKELRLTLGNFYDDARLLVRINSGTPAEVTGGELTQVAGNLYLLAADSAEVIIQLDQ